MNLELLDPFGRQIPDRIDATLALPPSLHFSAASAPAAAAAASGAAPDSSASAATRRGRQKQAPRRLSAATATGRRSKAKRAVAVTSEASVDVGGGDGDEAEDDGGGGGGDGDGEEDEEDEGDLLEEEEDERDNDEEGPGTASTPPAASAGGSTVGGKRRFPRGQREAAAAAAAEAENAGSSSSTALPAVAATSGGGTSAAAGSSSRRIAGGKSGGKTVAGSAALMADCPEWKAAYHVAFNRRGTYLAVGYGSSAVAVFNTLGRTLSALYPAAPRAPSPGSRAKTRASAASGTKASRGRTASPPPASAYVQIEAGDGQVRDNAGGVTSLTWSRRSRTLLAGAAGVRRVKLHDTTHPVGPEEACRVVLQHPQAGNDASAKPDKAISPDGPDLPSNAAAAASATPGATSLVFVPDLTLRKSRRSSWKIAGDRADGAPVQLARDGRLLKAVRWDMGTVLPSTVAPGEESRGRLSGDDEGGVGKFLSGAVDAPAPQLPTPPSDGPKTKSKQATPKASPADGHVLPGDRPRQNQQRHRGLLAAMRRHPFVSFDFPRPVGGALQVRRRLLRFGRRASD
jgi:hypothetical protein